MKPYLVKTPKCIQRIYSKRIWAFPKEKNKIYLTFDDGPNPQVTPWVLDELIKYNAQATFFCIGDNIKKHPEIVKRILTEGHSLGNHTYNHLNGWKTKTKSYIDNCDLFEDILKLNSIFPTKFKNSNLKSLINMQQTTSSKLFRPPFGKLTTKQSISLQQKGYKIIMWDVLSADFDKNSSKEQCLDNVIKNVTHGSIVVFHDSLKAEEKLRYVLPNVLDYLNKRKIVCKSIQN